MMGVLLHVIGDAVNNIAVIISAAIIWRTNYGGRDYADPCASIFIAILILLSSLPLGMSDFLSETLSLLYTNHCPAKSNAPALSYLEASPVVLTSKMSNTI